MTLLSPPGMGLLFGLSELALLLYRRAGHQARRGDQGTLQLFWLVIPLAFSLAYAATAMTPSLGLPGRRVLVLSGLLLFVLGLSLRWWAIVHLGRWFTVNLALALGQPLVQDGPYRWLRHPSYTGALLAMLGIGLCLAHPLALLALSVLVWIPFLRRIVLEEKLLAEAFGPRWTAYAQRTRRLLPGLW